nr:CPD-II=serine carboxypeptidase {N-terminal} [Aspergillus niger, Peptide Partial, 19 aa] [Aspergillus niger]
APVEFYQFLNYKTKPDRVE